MNVAEWILVAFLSCALLTFLILGIILLIKLIQISNEAKKIVVKGQEIADQANDVVGNVKDMTSVGGLVKTFVKRYNSENNHKQTNTKKDGQSGKIKEENK